MAQPDGILTSPSRCSICNPPWFVSATSYCYGYKMKYVQHHPANPNLTVSKLQAFPLYKKRRTPKSFSLFVEYACHFCIRASSHHHIVFFIIACIKAMFNTFYKKIAIRPHPSCKNHLVKCLAAVNWSAIRYGRNIMEEALCGSAISRPHRYRLWWQNTGRLVFAPAKLYATNFQRCRKVRFTLQKRVSDNSKTPLEKEITGGKTYQDQA